jgi:hypothetical protein
VAGDAPPRRRGRPALKTDESSVNCHLRLPVSEYDTAYRLARKNGVSISYVLRSAFRLAVKRPRGLDEP